MYVARIVVYTVSLNVGMYVNVIYYMINMYVYGYGM